MLVNPNCSYIFLMCSELNYVGKQCSALVLRSAPVAAQSSKPGQHDAGSISPAPTDSDQ